MALQLMKDVGIPNDEEHINDYPHQWSGGMLHRAVIAIALAAAPEILIADEPTSFRCYDSSTNSSSDEKNPRRA